jgi:lauroyl/myristoyl acyltransferase
VVIVPFFGTTLAMQTVGEDLSAETKHTWIVPRCAPNCAGPHRGLGIRHKESQVTREDGDVIGRNTIGRLGELVGGKGG